MMEEVKAICPGDDLSDLFLVPNCGFDSSIINHHPSKLYTLEFGSEKEVWVQLLGVDRFLFGEIEMVTDNLPNEQGMIEFNGSNDRDSATILIPVDNWKKAVELYLKHISE